MNDNAKKNLEDIINIAFNVNGAAEHGRPQIYWAIDKLAAFKNEVLRFCHLWKRLPGCPRGGMQIGT